MLIDGKIDERERSLCKVFAMKLGFRTAIVDKLILDIIESATIGMAKDFALLEILGDE